MPLKGPIASETLHEHVVQPVDCICTTTGQNETYRSCAGAPKSRIIGIFDIKWGLESPGPQKKATRASKNCIYVLNIVMCHKIAATARISLQKCHKRIQKLLFQTSREKTSMFAIWSLLDATKKSHCFWNVAWAHCTTRGLHKQNYMSIQDLWKLYEGRRKPNYLYFW